MMQPLAQSKSTKSCPGVDTFVKGLPSQYTMILNKQIYTRKSLYLSNLVVLSLSYMVAWEAISQDIFEIASASGVPPTANPSPLMRIRAKRWSNI